MNGSDTEGGRPVAWKAVPAGVAVRASDGSEVGNVVDALGSAADDIFHGIVVRRSDGSEAVILAEHVSGLSTTAIDVDLAPDAVAALPAREAAGSPLGLTSLLRGGEGSDSSE